MSMHAVTCQCTINTHCQCTISMHNINALCQCTFLLVLTYTGKNASTSLPSGELWTLPTPWCSHTTTPPCLTPISLDLFFPHAAPPTLPVRFIHRCDLHTGVIYIIFRCDLYRLIGRYSWCLRFIKTSHELLVLPSSLTFQLHGLAVSGGLPIT